MTIQKKRNLFDELSQGIEAINRNKDIKMTLKTHKIEKKPVIVADAGFIRRTREALHMSRNIFALKLRISPRTLEKWEQGKSMPNEQASVLITMVNKYPDMLKRLDEL